ncbi:methyltransferase family protein [Antricoccus suffuscus]|uniref:Methyltransferase family protein n=1 Tax=Antricoccus suffuscus TaxID=1629062 RepID=A0A2T0Z6B7_9ACTN|nr:class I SAM-dependent methyltransferase [Antricoccus suffuscus]PRZ31704.1 methyltransferase family protein [Antricoccus suffuscus]
MSAVIRSPNIWDSPAVYEIENHAVDPDGRLLRQLRAGHDWTAQAVLDIGCGTGFYLPTFAGSARQVIGVEPHPPLVAGARRRVRNAGLANVDVRAGTAQQLPVPNSSVDVAHARWAYFFGPGCEPGLIELDRVMRRGGTAFIIDNDASRSTFGGWFRRAWPQYDVRAVETFFSSRGWARQSIDMGWRFSRRTDFESVVRIEFAPALAAQIIAEHAGLDVDYAVNLWIKTF